MMNTKKTQIIGSCMLLLSICLQCFSQPKSIQKVLPQYQKNPNVSLGGYSVTLANGDDTTGIFKPTNCSLALPAIGIVKVTANTADNFIDIPLATMAASAGYNFETNVYKIFKLRIQADKKIEGNLVVEYTTIFEGKSETFAASVAHKKGDWVEHALDFSKVPQWHGSLTNIKLKMMEGVENIGLSVLIDKIELVSDDESDKTFGLNPLLLNVIQRVKMDTKNYRSEVEDIANFKGETLPQNSQNLDGRIYYFAKDNGTDRTAINRYFNKATGDYLDAIKQPSNGYIIDAELGFVWTKYYPGMSPVLRAINKKTGLHTLVVATEKKEGYIVDDTLGFAYARNEKPLQKYEFESDAMDDIFYINSGKVRFGVNLSHGAAGWHWYHGNKQMENINDFGRQVQLSYYTNKLNPSEVGFGRGQVGNPVAFVYKIGNTLVTRTVPIDWNFKNVLRDEGSISHPDIIPGIILGKDVTFGILGHAELAKWTAYVHTPVAIDKYNGGSQLEIFSNHPTADMWYRANVDFDNNGKLFISATKTNLEKQPDEEKGAFYNYPKSGFGGNISALGAEDNQLAFGLMVGTYSDEKNKILSNAYYTFAGENRTHSSRHVNISAAGKLGPEHASPFDNYTTAQRSVMRSPTVAGDNRYIVYAMTGTMADVKAWMQDLYNHRAELEW